MSEIQEVTARSPRQTHKTLRLSRAPRLTRPQDMHVVRAEFEVGNGSGSRFSPATAVTSAPSRHVSAAAADVRGNPAS